MTSRGVRISDKINRVISVKLIDILSEIPKGNSFYWSILFLDVMQKTDSQILFSSFQNQILKFPRGFILVSILKRWATACF